MENKVWKENVKLRHGIRSFRFKTREIPTEKKYVESVKNSLVILGGTVFIALLSLYFSNYSQNVLKISIFAILINCYKIFQVLTVPLLKLDETGLQLRTVKIPWNRIKKFDLNWNNRMLNLEILLNNGKIANEKVEYFHFMDYVYLHQFIRAFKKKYRNKYKFVHSHAQSKSF